MTKAKAPTGNPVWYSHAHNLSDEAKAALVKALGYNLCRDLQCSTVAECLRLVEYWLGFYRGGVAAIDNAPAPSVYIKEIGAVRDNALEMLRLLNSPNDGINPFTRDTLDAHFEEALSISGPSGVAKASLAAGYLLAACTSALNALSKEKSKKQGRRRAGAREIVLCNLIQLYQSHSKQPPNNGGQVGFIKNRSSFDQGEINFVRAAFADIGENRFNDADSDKKWAELIRAARTTIAKQTEDPPARKKVKK